MKTTKFQQQKAGIVQTQNEIARLLIRLNGSLAVHFSLGSGGARGEALEMIAALRTELNCLETLVKDLY